MPEEARYKNTQWIVLNRKHAQLMADDQKWWRVVAQYEADNELYPASFLALQRLLHEVEKTDTTYVNWQRKNPPGTLHSYPYIFSHLDQDDELTCIVEAIRKGFLFGRKFDPKADLSPLIPYLEFLH